MIDVLKVFVLRTSECSCEKNNLEENGMKGKSYYLVFF